MFTVREAHFKAFEKAAVERFVEETLPHLRRYFPRHCHFLGDEQMGRVIRWGLDRARGHGLTTEANVRRYLCLMCLLGSGFDADPQMPWAAAILAESVAHEDARAVRLYDRAMEYLDHVAPDFEERDEGSGLGAELGKLRHVPETPFYPPELAERLVLRLHEVFPRKCAHVGDEAIRRLIAHAFATAQGYGIDRERGAVLVVAMMFALGSGFDRDPLLPWVEAILRDPATPGQRERVDRLYAEAVGLLRQWVAWGKKEVPA